MHPPRLLLTLSPSPPPVGCSPAPGLSVPTTNHLRRTALSVQPPRELLPSGLAPAERRGEHATSEEPSNAGYGRTSPAIAHTWTATASGGRNVQARAALHRALQPVRTRWNTD